MSQICLDLHWVSQHGNALGGLFGACNDVSATAARTDAGGIGVGAMGCGDAGLCVTAPGAAASAALCGAGGGGCCLVIAVCGEKTGKHLQRANLLQECAVADLPSRAVVEEPFLSTQYKMHHADMKDHPLTTHRVLVAAIELLLHRPQLRQQHLTEGGRHHLCRQARDVRRDAVPDQQVRQLVAAPHKHGVKYGSRTNWAGYGRHLHHPARDGLLTRWQLHPHLQVAEATRGLAPQGKSLPTKQSPTA